MDEIITDMSNLYDSAFKDGVDFCIKVLQAYGEDNEEVNSFFKAGASGGRSCFLQNFKRHN